jgi:hypothetical protein
VGSQKKRLNAAFGTRRERFRTNSPEDRSNVWIGQRARESIRPSLLSACEEVSMGFRSLVLLSIVTAVFSLTPPVHAQASSSGTGGSTSASGTGGGANCNVAQESIAGSTCAAVTCDPSCSGVPSGYNYVCTTSSTVQVWCNGPVRNTPSDQNVSCTVTVPGVGLGLGLGPDGGSRPQTQGGPWNGVVAGSALALAIALRLRRRRRA